MSGGMEEAAREERINIIGQNGNDGLHYENIQHPSHYTFGKYEVIEILEDWFKDDPLLWQVGKYISRSKYKGKELEDLKKAQFYLQRKINILEGNDPERNK